ncbi:MAG: hypothetical protein NT067_04805 [Candidatus Diapherotrites archaeon]|nr:hypothetical protein [Candidatus Diapherotrites archaeon]
MERKGINPQEAKEIVERAYLELFTLSAVDIEAHTANILVLDIDKKTGKALFAIVDYTNSKKTSGRS